MLERFKIIALCILAAILYGEIHDQITVRIYLDYFTRFHPPIFDGTQNPTLLAVGWGFIATWWVGFFLGVPLSLCASIGPWPKLTAKRLIKPVAFTLVLLAIFAASSGLAGYLLVTSGKIDLPEDFADDVAYHDRARFMATSLTHLASYAFGALLGIALCIRALFKRYKLAIAHLPPN